MKPGKHSPVKDRRTVPWVSEDEIPAVKLALRAWRALRRDRERAAFLRRLAKEADDPAAALARDLEDAATLLASIAALEARLAKENTAE